MSPFADLRFTESHRWRPIAVVAPEFAEAVDLEGGPPATGPVAPYAAVELDLGAVRGTVTCGLSEVRAAYDAARGQVRIEVAGQVVRRRRRRFTVGTTLGFALCENQVTALARAPGQRWRPILTERDRVRAALDLRDPTTLGAQRWAWSGTAGEVQGVRHGPFGMLGVRDPQLVRHADGTPYVEEGRFLVTWTCAGPGGFRQAHWGVFSVDLDDPTRMRQTAQIYVRRGGRVHGDHAGALVRHEDRWLVMVSSWGDFTPERGVHARGAISSADLVHGVHLVDTELLDLPEPAGRSTWDPSLRRCDDGWLLSYVAAPSVAPFRFHPALARTSSGDPFTDLRPVGAGGPAEGLTAGEGPVLVDRAGSTWLVASDGARRRFPVFESTSMAPAGALDAAYPSNIPHPQLLERQDGSWMMLTFDGTRLERRRRESGRRPVLGYGTHGDAVVMRAWPDPDRRGATSGGAR